MDKYTVDLDQVLNDFEYNELTDQINVHGNNSRQTNPIITQQTKHSITNVFHSLNEYLNTTISTTNNNNNTEITPTQFNADNKLITIVSRNDDDDDELKQVDFNETNPENIPIVLENVNLNSESEVNQVGHFGNENSKDSHLGNDESDVSHLGIEESEVGHLEIKDPEVGHIENEASEVSHLDLSDLKISKDNYVVKNNSDNDLLIEYQLTDTDNVEKTIDLAVEDNSKTTLNVINDSVTNTNQIVNIEDGNVGKTGELLENCATRNSNELSPIESKTNESDVTSMKECGGDVSINANKTDLIIIATNSTITTDENSSVIEMPSMTTTTTTTQNDIILEEHYEETNVIGFDDNNIELDDSELNQYLNDLEKEYEESPDVIIKSLKNQTVGSTDEMDVVGCDVTKQNGDDEIVEIIESEVNNDEIIIKEETNMNNNVRPSDLPIEKREINLIGEPGSTPYNNVYVNKELPNNNNNNNNNSEDTSECSTTTSASPTFSDVSSDTTASSSGPVVREELIDGKFQEVLTNKNSNSNVLAVDVTTNQLEGVKDEVIEVGAASTITTTTTSQVGGEGEDEETRIDNDSNTRNESQNVVEQSEGTISENNVWLGKQAPLWIPDGDTDSCLHCDIKFTVIKRRHHCRACGLVLCSKCCNLRYRLEYLDNNEARVCIKCYEILNKDYSSGSEHTTPELGNSPNHQSCSISQQQPNPNNPLEYCSTIPPLQQINNNELNNQQPPSVMVPVGVLKRKGSQTNKNRINKSVMFCDGIRPGSDLTNLDNDFNYNHNNNNNNNENNKLLLNKKLLNNTNVSNNKSNVNIKRIHPNLIHETKSFIPNNDNSLPPIITIFKNDISYTDCMNNSEIVKQLMNETIIFALQLNLYVHLKIVNMDCCVNKLVWCFTTEGLINVGQNEIVLLIELLEDENFIPKDIFYHINNIYLDAVKGISIKELGLSLHDTSNFLDSKNHAGFIYIRSSFQCLQNIIKPEEPFLFGILIHRWETPWAKLFPLRLVLRLGAEYRYYPCPIISTRHRDSVFVEIGHTIINLLADFRNFSYTLPQIRGLTIHMEDKNTTITIPSNRYDQVMKSLNNSSDHILAFAGTFSLNADSYLVCIQDTQSNENSYTTHAINIHNKPRKVTGASFIVFNGALKSTSGLTAKSSIVEDGLMIQIPSEHMLKIRDSLRNMKNHTIQCGCINAQSDETVNIIWGKSDDNFNINVLSPIDNQSMGGVPSIRVHNGKDYICNSGSRLIRWTEVFIIQNGEEPSSSSSRNQDPVDISKVSESIAKATCTALVKYLDLLVSNNFFKIAIRTTLHVENVSYSTGSNSMKLPPIYMKSLDNELIPVLHRITSNNFSENAIILELIFRILNN